MASNDAIAASDLGGCSLIALADDAIETVRWLEAVERGEVEGLDGDDADAVIAALSARLDALDEALPEKAARVVAYIDRLDTEAGYYAAQAHQIAAFGKRKTAARDRLRGYLSVCLERIADGDAGVSVPTPVGTVSLSKVSVSGVDVDAKEAFARGYGTATVSITADTPAQLETILAGLALARVTGDVAYRADSRALSGLARSNPEAFEPGQVRYARTLTVRKAKA